MALFLHQVQVRRAEDYIQTTCLASEYSMEARPELHPLLSPAPQVSRQASNLKPYGPFYKREKIKQHPELEHFKLDWNESTVQPSPKVREALQQFLSNGSMLNWYPDMFYQPLYQRLAEYTGSRI